MSRPLRHAPPLADRRLLLRPRLLASLRTRFERPLTAVVAAAGFGKTTLLSQALSENVLAPLGEDRWLTCQRDDAALSFLAAGAFHAVGLTSPSPRTPTPRRWPWRRRCGAPRRAISRSSSTTRT